VVLGNMALIAVIADMLRIEQQLQK
jgi:hypothetical protein